MNDFQNRLSSSSVSMYSGSGFIRPARVPQLNASKSLVTAQPRKHEKTSNLPNYSDFSVNDDNWPNTTDLIDVLRKVMNIIQPELGIRSFFLVRYPLPTQFFPLDRFSIPFIMFTKSTNSVMKFIQHNKSLHDSLQIPSWSSSNTSNPFMMTFTQSTNSIMKFIQGNQSLHDVHSDYQFPHEVHQAHLIPS